MDINNYISTDLASGKLLSEAYSKAEPFPHIILDNFLNTHKAERLYMEYPAINEFWLEYNNQLEKKRAIDDILKLPESHAFTLMLMNSGPVINFLEDLTGISGLIPDPNFRGGGLHQITKGGNLALHADFNFHKKMGIHRRLNVLIYFNKSYKPEHGGFLELWNKDVTKCVQKIEPVFNRMVCFNTTDNSIHGHPEKWNHSLTRKSMALYYYSAQRPESELSDPHSTMFKLRPEDDRSPEMLELIEKRNKGRLSSNV